MYYLFTDETNKDQSAKVEFFIYGGLILNEDQLIAISNFVIQLRKKYKFQKGDDLKFHTRSRPKYISREAYTTAKIELVEFCNTIGCVFISYLILHKVAERGTDLKYNSAYNHLFGRFQKFLNEKDDYGLCFLDRFTDFNQWAYIKDKFTIGLDFKNKDSRSLNRILDFSINCNNSSNISSAVDIILGSFRYCINNNSNLIKEMIVPIVQMMWGRKFDGDRYLGELGLIIRPKGAPEIIRKEEYKQSYIDLYSKLDALFKDID